MHTVLLAWQSAKIHPKRTLLMLGGLVLSVAISSAITVFSSLFLAMLEFDAIQTALQHASVEVLLREFHQNTEYMVALAIFRGLTVIGMLAAAYFIHHILLLNQNERAETLSRLTLLGSTPRQRIAYVLADALLYAPAVLLFGVPLGALMALPSCQLLYCHLVTLFSHPEYLDSFLRIRLQVGKELLLLVVVALLALFGGCLPAARKAKNSGALTLIRTDRGIEVSLHRRWFDRLLIRLFGEVGRLSVAGYYNNRRHYRGMSATLSFAATLLLFFFTLIGYLAPYMTAQEKTTWTMIYGGFAALIFATVMVVGFCMFVVQFRGRTWELSLYRSIGMEEQSLHRMLLLEGVYYGVHISILTLFASFACHVVLYALLRLVMDDLIFRYPILPTLAVLGSILAFSVVVSIYMLWRTRRISIIGGIRAAVRE